MGYVADLFDVLAEPTRRDILVLLAQREKGLLGIGESQAGPGELSVGDLVGRLGVNQPTVSKHLKVLRDNGLVEVREDAQHRFYRMSAAPLGQVRAWIDQVNTDSSSGAQPGATEPYLDLGVVGYQVGVLVARASGLIRGFTQRSR